MSFNRKQTEHIYEMSFLWNATADIKRMGLIYMYCEDHPHILSEKSKSHNNIQCIDLMYIFIRICIN